MTTLTALDRVLTDIFDRGAEQRLDLAAERVAIAAAKQGDEAATIALMYAYAAPMRRVASRSDEILGRHEARAAVVGSLYEAIAAFDMSSGARLAGTLAGYLADGMAEEHATRYAVAVPVRSLKRFFGIMRRADNDAAAALALAPKYDMSREAFLCILDAVRAGSLDEAMTEEASNAGDSAVCIYADRDGFADADDRILVELAFSVVDDLETDVCRMAYGFTDYEPLSDGEIADRIGTYTKAVQRKRTGALTKMRAALGA